MPQQRDIHLHHRAREKLHRGEWRELRKVVARRCFLNALRKSPRGRLFGNRRSERHASKPGCNGHDARCSQDESKGGPEDARAAVANEDPTNADQPCRAHDREDDVEERLTYELSAPVQESDDWRVDSVEEQHERRENERAYDMRRALERGEPGSSRRKHRREREGYRRMNLDRRPEYSSVPRSSSRDGATHALRRTGDDDVIQDICEREHAGERAVSGKADGSRQHRLLHEARHYEKDLGAEHGETATTRVPGHSLIGSTHRAQPRRKLRGTGLRSRRMRPLARFEHYFAKRFAKSPRRCVREPIPYAADRLDIVARESKLLTKALHVRIHSARRDVGFNTPDVL